MNKLKKYNEETLDLNYKGKFTNQKTVVEVYAYDELECVKNYITDKEKQLDFFEQSFDDKVYWINVIGLNDIDIINAIGNRFSIYDLHLEDILHVSKYSKIEVEEDYLMTLNQMIQMDSEITREGIILFLTENVLISFQEKMGDIFDNIRKEIEKFDSRIRDSKTDYLYYRLLDRLVDEKNKVLKKLEIELTRMEELLIEDEDIDTERAYQIRKYLLQLKTAIFPLVGLIRLVISDKNDLISQKVEKNLEDVEDHINNLVEEIKRNEEMLNGLFERKMIQTSNEMNNIMKILTVFSTIFIPLTFLTGVYGMNFKYLPGMDSPFAFMAFVLISFVISGAMIAFFKYKKWF